MKKNIFVIVGESGTGKSTLAKGLSITNKDIELLVTSTSRPPRIHEIDKVDYTFLSRQDFEGMIKAQRFVEYAVFRDWYYGLNKETIYNSKSENMLVVLSPIGLKNLVNSLDKNKYNIIPIYIYASERVRLVRSLERDSDVEEVLRRKATDSVDFEGVSLYVLENDGHIIRNDNEIEFAVGQLEQVVEMVLGANNG